MYELPFGKTHLLATLAAGLRTPGPLGQFPLHPWLIIPLRVAIFLLPWLFGLFGLLLQVVQGSHWVRFEVSLLVQDCQGL